MCLALQAILILEKSDRYRPKIWREVVSEERKRALNCQSVSGWNRAIVSLAEGATSAAAAIAAKRAKLARFLPGKERYGPLHS